MFTWRTVSDKVLRDKTFGIAKNKRDENYHQHRFTSMVYKFFDKKSTVTFTHT